MTTQNVYCAGPTRSFIPNQEPDELVGDKYDRYLVYILDTCFRGDPRGDPRSFPYGFYSGRRNVC